MRIIRKIKEVGLKNILVGGVRRVGYVRLLRKHHFDTWHLVPYEWREYTQACAQYINAHGGGTVVDIGCGLGGVLQHIKAERRIGLDLHEGKTSGLPDYVELYAWKRGRNMGKALLHGSAAE